MNASRIVLSAAALFCIAGCATRADLSNVQMDLDEVKTRTLQMDKELQE